MAFLKKTTPLQWLLRATITACALQSTLVLAQEEKSVSWRKTEKSNFQCHVTASYTLQVFPDKLGIKFAAGWEIFTSDSAGVINKTTFLPGGVRLLVEANTKTRVARVTNIGNLGCVWEGSY